MKSFFFLKKPHHPSGEYANSANVREIEIVGFSLFRRHLEDGKRKKKGEKRGVLIRTLALSVSLVNRQQV